VNDDEPPEKTAPLDPFLDAPATTEEEFRARLEKLLSDDCAEGTAVAGWVLLVDRVDGDGLHELVSLLSEDLDFARIFGYLHTARLQFDQDWIDQGDDD
jgi:hypothetical protein